MHRSIIALAACAGLTVAQNSTIGFFWPYAVTFEVPAITVQSADTSATVLKIACSTRQMSSCEWGQGMNVTILDGSTYEATMTNATYSITRTCVAKETPSVDCFMEGSDKASPAEFAAREHWSEDSPHMVVATIESGVEKLAAATSSTPSPAGGSSAAATVASTSSPQTTGAAGDLRAQSAIVLLCAAAVALYM